MRAEQSLASPILATSVPWHYTKFTKICSPTTHIIINFLLNSYSYLILEIVSLLIFPILYTSVKTSNPKISSFSLLLWVRVCCFITMGGSFSKKKSVNPYSKSGYVYEGQHQQQQHELQMQESKDKENKEPGRQQTMNSRFAGYSSSEDEFYDGIPRFRRSSSRKSKSRRVAKVAEVSSRLGSAGFVRTVEALDIIGSSLTNLNLSSGFVSSSTIKGNELSILSFEVANTIVKGSSLMHSLSRRSIRQLKDVVLPSEGVQLLVSNDMDELLSIVSDDKRKELHIFAGEVVRFGNQCKDPQWHNLDRFFQKYRREPTPQKQLREETELMMQQLTTLVQYTAELYHELHTLDKIEQDYQHKRLDNGKLNTSQKGDGLTILAAELKSQKKIVRNLKKKSLWSRSLEEVMDKLVDIALFLNREIDNIFGNADPDSEKKQSLGSKLRLGPAGLDLHYANIILQIDSIVARSSSMPPNARDTLYQNIPPNIKFSLRSKILSFHVKEQLTVIEIKAEMEKTLHWLVPVATITAKAHHGFGWVGEWANAGSESNRRSVVSVDVIQIETLHHADKQKSEAYILDLILWLNHLVAQSKATSNGGCMSSLVKPPQQCSFLEIADQQPTQKSAADQGILQEKSKRTRGISKSQDFDSVNNRSKKLDRLSKSNSYSATTGSKELLPEIFCSSSIPVTTFGLDKERKLDAIDRVDICQ